MKFKRDGRKLLRLLGGLIRMENLVIQDRNPVLLERLRDTFPGKILIEIAPSGKGDSLSYIVANSYSYVNEIWDKDNQLNGEFGFLGMTQRMVL